MRSAYTLCMSTSTPPAVNCYNSKTRDAVSGKEAERGWVHCSRCGARTKIRVHWPKKEGDSPEGTMMAHKHSVHTHTS